MSSIIASQAVGAGRVVWIQGDRAYWWFGLNAAGNQIVAYRSTDRVNWMPQASSPTFPTGYTANNGRDFTVAYKRIAGVDVLHVGYGCLDGSHHWQHRHVRATISAGIITWGTDSEVGTLSTSNNTNRNPEGISCLIDSNNFPVDTLSWDASGSAGNPCINRATNADTGTAWTAGWGTTQQLEHVNGNSHSSALFDLGAGNVLSLWDNPDTGTIDSAVFGASLSAIAAVFPASSTDWAVAAVSTSDIHAVGRSGSTLTHLRFNGTAWVAGASIPSQASKSGVPPVMVSPDGLSVYLFVVDSDGANTVRYIRWSATTGLWDSAWSVLDPTAQVRSGLTCCMGNAEIAVVCATAIGSLFTVLPAALEVSMDAQDGIVAQFGQMQFHADQFGTLTEFATPAGPVVIDQAIVYAHRGSQPIHVVIKPKQ
jgi:hypothetical protein